MRAIKYQATMWRGMGNLSNSKKVKRVFCKMLCEKIMWNAKDKFMWNWHVWAVLDCRYQLHLVWPQYNPSVSVYL